MKLKLIFYCLCFFFLFPINAGITTIHFIKEISEKLEKTDTNSLVVFDIDYVLLIPKDKLLRPCGKEMLKKTFSKVFTDTRERDLYNLMLLHAEEEVLEPEILHFVHLLQKRKIPTMALTSRWTSSNCNVPWEIIRIDQLRKFGLDFNSGVLFSNLHSKGRALREFLLIGQVLPKQILFIDDQIENLRSVESELKDLGIDVLCFHYLFAHDQIEQLDFEVVQIQIQKLFNEGKWISDEEAQVSMELIFY